MKSPEIKLWLAGLRPPFEESSEPQETPPAPVSREEILKGLSQGQSLYRRSISEIVRRYLSQGTLDAVFLEHIYATKLSDVRDYENPEQVITHAIVRGCDAMAFQYLKSPLLSQRIVRSFNHDLICNVDVNLQGEFLGSLIEICPIPELMNIGKDIYSLIVILLVTPVSERLPLLTGEKMTPHILRVLVNVQGTYNCDRVTDILELLPKKQHAEFCAFFKVKEHVEEDEVAIIDQCVPHLYEANALIYPIGLLSYSRKLLYLESKSILNGTSAIALKELPGEILANLFNNANDKNDRNLILSEEFQMRISRIARSTERLLDFLEDIWPKRRLALLTTEYVKQIFVNPTEDEDDYEDEHDYEVTGWGKVSLFFKILQLLPVNDWEAFCQIEACRDLIADFMSNGELSNLTRLKSLENVFDSNSNLARFIISSPMKAHLNGFFDSPMILSLFLCLLPHKECWSLIAENKAIQDIYIRFVGHDDPSLLFLRLLDFESSTFGQRAKVLEITEKAYQHSPKNDGLSCAQYQRFHFFHRVPLDANFKFIEALRDSVQVNQSLHLS